LKTYSQTRFTKECDIDLETQLSKEIYTSSKDAKYDRCCKNLLSHRTILAHIMKECVSEFKDFDIKYIANNCIEGAPQISEVSVHRGNPDKIVGANTEDATIDEGTVYFDIRFVAVLPQTGENIRLIINIEAQNNFNPHYSLIRRGIYYCCRLISAQYETEFTSDNYDDIKKVYSIWICTNTPNYAANTINRYCITEQSLVGNFKINPDKYDMFNVIMVNLEKDSDSIENNNKSILGLLRILLSSSVSENKKIIVLENDFDLEMTVAFKKELSNMCNLSTGVREEGRLLGREEGRLEGKLEGRLEGARLKQIENLKKMMTNLKLTFDEAANALELSDDEKKLLSDKV
jgi:predicted transposase/invertase (TIGR01784 family)